MHLTQTAEYALRAMTHLALQPPGTAMRGKDLAEAANVPRHYISKLLRKLVVAGLLTSRKGHGGGFTLLRPPGEITFAEVFAAVGYSVSANRCAFGWAKCDGEAPCPLHAQWVEMANRFGLWAEGSTLAGEVAD